jgi:hypothetical protein
MAVGCAGTDWETVSVVPSRHVELSNAAVLSGADLPEVVMAAALTSDEIPVLPRVPRTPPTMRVRKLESAGPRFGLIQVTGQAAETLSEEYGASSMLTGWGWQYDINALSVQRCLHRAINQAAGEIRELYAHIRVVRGPMR